MGEKKYLNCPSSYICVRRGKMPLHLNVFLLDGRKSHLNTFDESLHYFWFCHFIWISTFWDLVSLNSFKVIDLIVRLWKTGSMTLKFLCLFVNYGFLDTFLNLWSKSWFYFDEKVKLDFWGKMIPQKAHMVCLHILRCWHLNIHIPVSICHRIILPYPRQGQFYRSRGHLTPLFYAITTKFSNVSIY